LFAFSHSYESIHGLNIPVNAPQQHCPILTSREAHTTVAVIREMAFIVDHVLPNAANGTFRASRSSDDFVASFPLCLRGLRRPVVLLLTCSDKSLAVYPSLTIPGSRHEALVLCCGAACNKPDSPGPKSDRCSCLRSGFSLEALT
jgi:hypothetical protein